jgi:hypothetical protein
VSSSSRLRFSAIRSGLQHLIRPRKGSGYHVSSLAQWNFLGDYSLRTYLRLWSNWYGAQYRMRAAMPNAYDVNLALGLHVTPSPHKSISGSSLL